DIIVTADFGGAPFVNIFESSTGMRTRQIQAYDTTFTSGVRTATLDVDGDGFTDVLVAPGRNDITVKVFEDGTGNLLQQFPGFDASLTAGQFIAGGRL